MFIQTLVRIVFGLIVGLKVRNYGNSGLFDDLLHIDPKFFEGWVFWLSFASITLCRIVNGCICVDWFKFIEMLVSIDVYLSFCFGCCLIIVDLTIEPIHCLKETKNHYGFEVK